MTSTTSTMRASGVASREVGESPSTLSTFHQIWERFEGFWRSALASDDESAVERFINERGGVLTDDLEREISRRFGRLAGPG